MNLIKVNKEEQGTDNMARIANAIYLWLLLLVFFMKISLSQ